MKTPNQNPLESEYNKFIMLKEALTEDPRFVITEIDDHGFTIGKQNQAQQKTDILITALTHGNEVIGLQIINLMLNKILETGGVNYTFSFLLNNFEAYRANQRYVIQDLNRCFGFLSTDNYETRRALQIKKLIKSIKPKLIIDLHQTIGETLSPFFVVPESESLIRSCFRFNSNWPIITFDQKGFSSEGSTLSEFAYQNNIQAFVIEVSQLGFDQQKALDLSDRLFYLNLDTLLFDQSKNQISYFKMTHAILKKSFEFELIPGLINLDLINQGQILGYSSSLDPFISPADGLILFPKYGDSTVNVKEYGYIATHKILL